MVNGQVEWEQEWRFLLEHAKACPAAWIGSREQGHGLALTSVIRLVWQAKVFTKPVGVKIDLSPNQFIVRCETGPLIRPVQEIYNWSNQRILDEDWPERTRAYSDRIDAEDEAKGYAFGNWRSRRGWNYALTGPTGPRLYQPTGSRMLAHRFVWGLRTSNGLWCQSFREGWPISKPIVLTEPSPVGIFAAAFLNREYFTGLPFDAEDVERFLGAVGKKCLDARPKWTMPENIAVRWHKADELLSDNDIQPENIAEWLAGH